MQTRIKKQKRFFWIILIAGFVLSGGYISATTATANTSTLVINEIMAANGVGLVDEDGEYSDWIEIYNPTRTPTNLSGWSLTNDPDQPQQWEFPDITLGGGDYLVVFASGKDRRPMQAGQPLHTNFKLSKSGEFLGLYSVLEDRFMDIVGDPFPTQFRDVSFGRTADEFSYGFMPHPTPGEVNNEAEVWRGTVEPVAFSIEHSFLNEPTLVELTTLTPDATIYYTTDGSAPTASSQEYTGPIELYQTTILRASAFKPGLIPAQTGTQTYLFTEDIVSQLGNPLRLPGNNIFGSVQPVTDHFHPVRNARYRAELGNSLQAIATVSVVLPEQQLHSLYLRPFDQDRSAERLASVEFLPPAAGRNSGFQANVGIRPYGDDSQTKKSFRLYFRGEYGLKNLNYPLFDDSPVTAFDTLTLQAIAPGQNSAEILREAWIQKTQQEISGLTTHQQFVHLYLNGKYWGLYRLAEHPNADFMATYIGGESSDWFMADHNGPRTNDSSVSAAALETMFSTMALAANVDESLLQPELFADTFSTLSTYFDPAQFSDFVLLNAYIRNQNWPEHQWLAAVRLTDLPGRGKLLLGSEQQQQPAPEMTANAATGAPVFKMLFDLWMENPDFEVMFADRVYQNLFNDGPLTDASAQARWDALNATLDQAIAVELARWGGEEFIDAAGDDLVNLEGTAATLVEMARAENYYPELDPPLFNRDTGLVEAGEPLTLRQSNTICTDCRIYYTTDGTDPRLFITGEVIPTAQEYRRPIKLEQNTDIKARVWQPPAAGSSQPIWSALRQADFSVVQQDHNLRITEVMYNPPLGDDYEYIELHNAGSAAINLARLSFEDGIRFSFSPNTPPLMPGEYAVLASNPTAFTQQYPTATVWGAYEGHLSNKGEHFALRTPDGETLLEVRYNDEYGWPVTADGRGDSLTLVDFDGNPDDPKSWRASSQLYGTPGF